MTKQTKDRARVGTKRASWKTLQAVTLCLVLGIVCLAARAHTNSPPGRRTPSGPAANKKPRPDVLRFRAQVEAALADALLQDPTRQAALLEDVIEPLAATQQARRDAVARKAAATQVQFFAMRNMRT